MQIMSPLANLRITLIVLIPGYFLYRNLHNDPYKSVTNLRSTERIIGNISAYQLQRYYKLQKSYLPVVAWRRILLLGDPLSSPSKPREEWLFK